ncbi:MAG: type II secretion system protein GspD [Elusimicrobiota bacterium]
MYKLFLLMFVGYLSLWPVRAQAPLEEPTVALNFENVDIDLVLRFMSEVTGTAFIKSDQIHGLISLTCSRRVSASEALDLFQEVLDLKGFTLVPGRSNSMKVLTRAEASQTNLEIDGLDSKQLSPSNRMITQVIPLKYMSAPEAKTMLSPLTSREGVLITDERMNSLIVTDMKLNIQRFKKIIDAVDVRTPQVLIEAMIMEISLTKQTKLGVEWSYSESFSKQGQKFSGELSQQLNVGSVVTEGLKYALIRSDLNLKGLLQALATDKNVNILSTPHILTLNNQPAIIRVGEEVPVLTQTRNIQGGETIRSFDFKSVAIELEVTPRINVNREVFLKVHPLIKKILGFNAELNAPILATREAQTSVLVQDGQTVVIGGLIKDDKSSSQSKIPILGSLPLIGIFFRKSDSTREKTELLVFITPHVIATPLEARLETIKKEAESKQRRSPHRLSSKESEKSGDRYFREKKFNLALKEWLTALDSTPDQRQRKRLKRKINRLNNKIN